MCLFFHHLHHLHKPVLNVIVAYDVDILFIEDVNHSARHKRTGAGDCSLPSTFFYVKKIIIYSCMVPPDLLSNTLFSGF